MGEFNTTEEGQRIYQKTRWNQKKSIKMFGIIKKLWEIQKRFYFKVLTDLEKVCWYFSDATIDGRPQEK